MRTFIDGVIILALFVGWMAVFRSYANCLRGRK